jgi:hypothetical protein
MDFRCGLLGVTTIPVGRSGGISDGSGGSGQSNGVGGCDLSVSGRFIEDLRGGRVVTGGASEGSAAPLDTLKVSLSLAVLEKVRILGR